MAKLCTFMKIGTNFSLFRTLKPKKLKKKILNFFFNFQPLFGPFFTLTLVHKTPIQGHQECPNQFELTHQSCRAQKIKFIEGLTYKFLSKIKALQELQKNVGASDKKLASPFLVHTMNRFILSQVLCILHAKIPPETITITNPLQ